MTLSTALVTAFTPILSAIEPIEAITSTPQITASTTNTNEIIKDSLLCWLKR